MSPKEVDYIVEITKNKLLELIREELNEMLDYSQHTPDPESLGKMYLISLRQKLDKVWKELEGAAHIAKQVGIKNVQVGDKDIENVISDSIRNRSTSLDINTFDQGVIERAFVQIIFSALESGALEFEE